MIQNRWCSNEKLRPLPFPYQHNTSTVIQTHAALARMEQLEFVSSERECKVAELEQTVKEKEEKEKNKLGIDADCDLIHIPTSKVIIQAFALDYKIRFTAYYPLDFLAEKVSVDYNNTPGWAVDPKKKTHAYLYIIEPIKKAIFVMRD